MMMLRNTFFTLLFLCITAGAHADDNKERWVVYYNNVLPVEKFMNYDVIAFDSDSHPDLAPLKAAHKILLGYIDLGEAEEFRSYYHDIAQKKLFLGKNPLWAGHHIIDIRKPEWDDYVINVRLPTIISQGFDGILIDALDSPLELEEDNPKKYHGMKEGAIRLIKAIRARYPNIKIMVNRGYAAYPEIALYINMSMGEDIYTDWQPDEKAPIIIPKKDREDYLRLLKTAKEKNPQFKVYTVDYWPPSDKKTIRHIYKVQRDAGFIPYVSTLDLQSIYPEP